MNAVFDDDIQVGVEPHGKHYLYFDCKVCGNMVKFYDAMDFLLFYFGGEVECKNFHDTYCGERHYRGD